MTNANTNCYNTHYEKLTGLTVCMDEFKTNLNPVLQVSKEIHYL